MAKKKGSQSSSVGAPINLGWDLHAEMAEMESALMRSRMQCVNGLSFSAQASSLTYCEPKENRGPYVAVEVGYPSRGVPLWLSWAEEPSNPTGSIYPRLPVGAVAFAVAQAGGRDETQEGWAAESLGRRQKMSDSISDSPSTDINSGQDTSLSPLRIIQLGDGVDVWLRACEDWVQMAALGSPSEEHLARFEVRDGDAPIMDWSRCLGCLLAGGFEAAAANDYSAWVGKMAEYAHIAGVSARAASAKRRPSL